MRVTPGTCSLHTYAKFRRPRPLEIKKKKKNKKTKFIETSAKSRINMGMNGGGGMSSGEEYGSNDDDIYRMLRRRRDCLDGVGWSGGVLKK